MNSFPTKCRLRNSIESIAQRILCGKLYHLPENQRTDHIRKSKAHKASSDLSTLSC